MAEIKRLESDRLSTYRTRHTFLRYGEFKTVDEFKEYRQWAVSNEVPLYILANGSNTLFLRRRISSLVLRNRLEPWMTDLGDGRLEVSSSLQVMRVLRYCEKQSLNSFYYLASVPATVGGALAMNAGMGGSGTIYDFVESVTYADGDQVKTLQNHEIERRHRQTMFTGVQDRLIVSAVLRFTHDANLERKDIRERIEWCHANQDVTAPSCGSVFRKCNRFIIRRVRGLPPFGINLPLFRTQYTRKVNNWIICRNSSSWPIVFLIRVVQLIHRLIGDRAETELVEVE